MIDIFGNLEKHLNVHRDTEVLGKDTVCWVDTIRAVRLGLGEVIVPLDSLFKLFSKFWVIMYEWKRSVVEKGIDQRDKAAPQERLGFPNNVIFLRR